MQYYVTAWSQVQVHAHPLALALAATMSHTLLATLIALLCLRWASAQTGVCGRTPSTLQVDFLANCEDLGLGQTTCSQAWAAFSGAFAGISPDSVTAR